MNAEEAREKLHPYFDGELPDAERVALEAALASDPTLQDELAELVAAQALMNEAFREEIDGVDLSGFADGVMSAIAKQEAQVPTEMPVEPALGWLDRMAAMLGLDGIGGAQWATAAALAALLGVGWWMAPGTTTVDEATEQVAEAPRKATSGRRGMETEELPTGRNAATVVSWEASRGRVEIAYDEADPDQPMVVWHVEGEEQNVPADTEL